MVVSTTAFGQTTTKDKDSVYGIWTGKIGNGDVVVCISKEDSNYYYLKHTKKIPLILNPDGRGFEYLTENFRRYEQLENRPNGEWYFIIENQTLTGELFTGNNRHTINLRKYIENPLPILLARALEEQIKYQDCPANFYIPIINARLKNHSNNTGDIIFSTNYKNSGSFTYNSNYLQPMYEVIINGAIEHYNGEEMGTYSSEIEIKKIHENDWFILVKDETDYYGGAHPSFEEHYYLFDRYTLLPIENWIKFESLDISGPYTTLSPFAKLLRDNYKGGNFSEDTLFCKDLIKQNFPSVTPAYPNKTGVVFQLQYPHVTSVCNEEVELRWHDLKAYMSPEGWKTMRRMAALQ